MIEEDKQLMLSESYKDKFLSLQQRFQLAEDKIKDAERTNSTLNIPSINELRYAGHHILKASVTTDSTDIDDELNKAEKHIERAIYDALEAMLLLKIEEIIKFDKQYREVPETLKVIPDFISKMNEVDSIVKELNSVESTNRIDRYNQIEERYYNRLESISNEMNRAIITIEALINENRKKEQKEARRFALTIGLTILGILLTLILTFVVTIFSEEIKSFFQAERSSFIKDENLSINELNNSF